MADPIVAINTDALPPHQITLLNLGMPLGGQPAERWWAQQSAQLQSDFMKQISQSMTSGESIYQATTRIIGGTIKGVKVPGIMKVARSRAEALVRTEVNTIVTATRLQTLQDMSDVVKGIQQVSTLDSRTSDICIAYSGQSWDIKTLKPLPPSTLPWNSGPPRHFNCRSTIVPVVKSARELGIPLGELSAGTRASMDGQVPGDITFADWLKKKGTAFQDELLGPARARLWREGKITLTQLVDMKGNPMTVAQLEAIAGVAKKATPAAAAAAVNQPPPRAADKTGEGPEAAAYHKASWDDAPDYIHERINATPPLAGVMKTGGKSSSYGGDAFYQSTTRKIAMGEDYQLGKAHAVGTWRHEYGHFLDNANGVAAAAQVGDAVPQSLWQAWVSTTTPFMKALQNDMKRFRLTPAKNMKVTKAYKEAKSALLARVRTATEGVPRGEAYIAAQTNFLNSELAKYSITVSELERLGEAIYKNIETMKASGYSSWSEFGRIQATRLLAALETGEWSQIKWMFHAPQNGGYLADFYGAITKNLLGHGHSTAYYDNWPVMQNKEAFANWVALQGVANHPVEGVLAKVIRATGSEFAKMVDDWLRTGKVIPP